MTVTWDVEIEVRSLADKLLRVVATRTDDVPIPAHVWSYSVEGKVDTSEHTLAEIRLALVNQIWANWLEYSTNEREVNALLSGWESDLETDLQAKEGG